MLVRRCWRNSWRQSGSWVLKSNREEENQGKDLPLGVMHERIGEKLRRGESASLLTMLGCWSSSRDSRGQGLLHGSSLTYHGAGSQISVSIRRAPFFLLARVCIGLWETTALPLLCSRKFSGYSWLIDMFTQSFLYLSGCLCVYTTKCPLMFSSFCLSNYPSFLDWYPVFSTSIILPFSISFSLSSLLLLSTQTSKHPSWHLSTHASIYPLSNILPSFSSTYLSTCPSSCPSIG